MNEDIPQKVSGISFAQECAFSNINAKTQVKCKNVSCLLQFADEFKDIRKTVEEYKKANLPDYERILSPDEYYLDEHIFPLLNKALVKMLHKAIENDSLKIAKTNFDGVDFLCEYLYNNNIKKHPERESNWKSIHDTEMAQRILKEKPRPIFPQSRIWSEDFAAKVIQSYVRGYWVRRTEQVQEMREFWKNLKNPFKGHVEQPTEPTMKLRSSKKKSVRERKSKMESKE